MVKGNAQRRIELAERRKLESFEEKERRLAGASHATPAEVRARLLSDVRRGAEEVGLIAWVATDGKFFCEDYFRTGTCPLKRCKFAHDETIAHLTHVPASSAPTVHSLSRLTVPMPAVRGRRLQGTTNGGDASSARSVSPSRHSRTTSSDANDQVGSGGGRSTGDGTMILTSTSTTTTTTTDEFPALKSMPLRLVNAGGVFMYDRTIRTQVRTESPLRFIAWGNRLVFDAANSSVFALYVDSEKIANAAIAAREKEEKELMASASEEAKVEAETEAPTQTTGAETAEAEDATTTTTTTTTTAVPPASPRPRVRFT
jgi:Zinc finger C-x8-C-x5-C-x3-H type (and similar)